MKNIDQTHKKSSELEATSVYLLHKKIFPDKFRNKITGNKFSSLTQL